MRLNLLIFSTLLYSYPQPSVKGSGSVQWLYDSLAKHWQFLGLSKDTAYNITRFITI